MTDRRPFICGLALIAALGLLSCTADSHTSSVSITDIHSVSELQSRFADDADFPRLILLLSPT